VCVCVLHKYLSKSRGFERSYQQNNKVVCSLFSQKKLRGENIFFLTKKHKDVNLSAKNYIFAQNIKTQLYEKNHPYYPCIKFYICS